MTKEEFFQTIQKSIPIKRKGIDFQEAVRLAYKQFVSNVSELEIDAFGDKESKELVIQEIKGRIEIIKLVIKKYYNGCHGEAYSILKKHLSNGDDTSLGLDIVNISITEKSKKYYFRARMNNGNISSIKDMFHIPNNMRGIVKTERFSAPGYPCLYIGNTVYDCWEEMGRPSFDDMVFSGFKVVREFKVYDLRKPAFSDYEKDRLHQTLLRLVYVIACQFKVCNREEPFKPEYIIPQMILELIISINRKKKEYDCGPYSLVWGVIYTSTHLSEDFPYREDFLENIAIPVIDTDNTHCNILASLFQISLPVCYRYEELKDNNTKNDQEKVDKNDTDINAIYFSTKMGFLESRIIENTKFEELPYIAIPCPDKILYDWKGNLTNIPSPDIQIYSNEAWHIETKKKPQE